MANTQKYLNHLLQNTGITPACSEEERAAADIIAKIFSAHGFEPEVQEFNASGTPKVVQAALGLAAFLGAVLMGIGGVAGIIGLLLAVAAAVVFTLERLGRPVLSNLGAGGLSQNVIAYHKASGPLASPRNRPVVVVAHYDSPRADLLCQQPFSSYRPVLVKLLPYAMLAPAVLAIVHLLPVPGAAKTILWVLAILAGLIPLANAVAIIANRFVLPYTSGAVCNKSSVAAMLGVMDAVAPYQGRDEFPDDASFDEFLAHQNRLAAEHAEAIEADRLARAEAKAARMAKINGLLKRQPSEEPVEEFEEAAVSDIDGVDGEDAGFDEPGFADESGDSDGTDAAVDDAVCEDETAAEDRAAVDLGETVPMDLSDDSGDVGSGADATTAVPALEDELAVEASDTADDFAPADVADAAVAAVHAEGQVEADEPTAQADVLEPSADTDDEPSLVNAEGNIRFGEETIRSLGMLPDSCALVYVDPDPVEEPEQTAFDVPAPANDDLYDPADAAGYAETDAYDDTAAYAEEQADGYDDEYDDGYAEEEDEGSEAGESYEGDIQYDEWEPIEDDEDDAPVSADADGADSDSIAFDQSTEVDPVLVDENLDGDAHSDDGGDVGVEGLALGDPDDDEHELFANSLTGSDTDEDAEGEAVDASEEPDPAPTDSTVSFDMSKASVVDGTSRLTGDSDDPSHTIAMPAETVDSLMEQIAPAPAPPARPQRVLNIPSIADAPVPHTPQTANRASLFDLPDPSAAPADPFAAAAPAVPAPASDQNRGGFTVISSDSGAKPVSPAVPAASPIERISAPAPQAIAEEKPKRGLSRLFGRKKKKDDSMSSWLGVEDGFDAKQSGRDIGSWDNFEGDDSGDSSWKGGATGSDELSEAELRDAITSMGDDELLGHDIWFVATGASENGSAGIKAFLASHRDKLRGVFLINLECVGAGQVAMVSSEGERRVLKGDKRIMKLVQRVSADFHGEYGAVDMPYVTTDAHAAMSMSLRSLTIGGIEGAGFALGHTEEDQPYNVDPESVSKVADVVTEVIRRS